MVRVPRGIPGTLHTARLIASMIREGARDFWVRQCAISIFRACGARAKDRRAEAAGLFHWVRRHIRYTRDPVRLETLHTPRRLLVVRAGDCDDMTILLGSMLLATGHPVRLALVGFRSDRPHAYSHIYPEVLIGRRWVALDATTPFPMGWAPPARWKRTWSVFDDDGAPQRQETRR